MYDNSAANLMVNDSTETKLNINKLYKYWRKRILMSIIIGYAMFYFLRQNFSIATIELQLFFNVSKTDIGFILSIHAIIYGIGKALWSIVSDRTNARYFMPTGLLAASIANICTAFSDNVFMLGVFWSINGCFLSMGAFPCIKLLTYWYTKNERATKWALWNSSQQFGAALAVFLCSQWLARYGWRSVFLAPGVIGVIMSLFLYLRLRDTPASIGLPTIETFKKEYVKSDPLEESYTLKEIIFKHLIRNKNVWILCIANMFFYIFRMGLLNWGPALLMEMKGSSLKLAGFQTALFDLSSIIGGITAGYISDKLLNGARSPLCIFSMVALALLTVGLLYAPSNLAWLQSTILMAMGACITAPQILVGVAVTDFASKKVAGTANGLTGVFGYIGSALSGLVLGFIAEQFGWNYVLIALLVTAVISALLFLLLHLRNLTR